MRWNLPKVLRSQSGQTLVVSIVLVAAGVITTLLMIDNSGLTKKQTRGPRIRSGMANMETKLRSLMLQPTTYVCPTPGQIDNCTIVDYPAKVRSLDHIVPGALCEPPAVCAPILGIVLVSQTDPLQPAQWNPATRTLTGQIRYTGTDLNLRPRNVTIIIPADVLNPVVQCPPATPLFQGFRSDGFRECTSVPPTNGACAPGEFISNINTETYAITCTPLPAPVTCAANEYITGMSWPGNASPVALTCVPRVNPLTNGEYPPAVSYGTPPPAYVAPAIPGPPFTNVCAPPAGSCGPPNNARGGLVADAGSCSGTSCQVGETLTGCFYEPGGFRSCCSPAATPPPPPTGTCGTQSYVFNAGSCNLGTYTPHGDAVICAAALALPSTGGSCPDAVVCSSCSPVVACNSPGSLRGGPYPNSSSCSALDCLGAETLISCAGSAGSYSSCCEPTASGGTACLPDGSVCGGAAACAADCCSGFGSGGACGP
jgi:hypothetical protein